MILKFITGALVYYIRRVLNDWPDDECVQILSKIRTACAPDSRVLICENLSPGEPLLGSAAIDLWMIPAVTVQNLLVQVPLRLR